MNEGITQKIIQLTRDFARYELYLHHDGKAYSVCDKASKEVKVFTCWAEMESYLEGIRWGHILGYSKGVDDTECHS